MKIILFLLLSIFGFSSSLNRSMIEKLSNHSFDRFSFVVMGDNRNGNNTLKKIISMTNRDKNIKFLINNGDLVAEGYKKEYKRYLQIIKTSNKPIINVIGNHELPWYDGKRNYREIFGKDNFSFSFGNSYFIVLDSSYKKIAPMQFEWLEKQLKKSQVFKNRFVISHVPLYDPREGKYRLGHSLKSLTDAKKLNRLFDKYKVTMFFASHIHSYLRGLWHKTPYIISGGAGAPLSKNGFYHYIKVIVDGSKIQYKVIKVDGKKPSFIKRSFIRLKSILNL